MRVKYVAISGMHNAQDVRYTFDQANYLYGKNGAGKSTAMQAVQLALLGYIPGLPRTNDAIFRHCKSGVMIVEVGLEGGGQAATVRRTWHRNKTTVHSGLDIQPEGFELESIISDLELPIFNFGELMSLSANKLKDWFIGFLPQGNESIDWTKRLAGAVDNMPIADEELLPETAKALKALPGKGIEQVRNANAYIKQQISFKKSDIARMQGTMQSLVYYDNVECSEDTATIQSQIQNLQAGSQLVTSYKYAVMAHERHNKQMEQYADLAESCEADERYTRAASAGESANASMRDLSEKEREIATKRAELAGRVTQLNSIINSGGICNYTKQPCESILKMIEDFKAQVAEMTADIHTLDDAAATCREERLSDQKVRDVAQAEMSQLRARYAERSRASAETLPTIPDIDPAWLTRDFGKEIQELTDLLAKVAANKQYEELMGTISREKDIAENTLTILKKWETLTGANSMQDELSTTPFRNLETRINEYLEKFFGAEQTCHFNLDQKANSFSFGLYRDKYIPYDLLSSGEKCMFAMALLSCIVQQTQSPLKLVMIDDMLDHLDDVNIDSVFQAMAKIEDIQFIVAGVKPCKLKKFVIQVGAL